MLSVVVVLALGRGLGDDCWGVGCVFECGSWIMGLWIVDYEFWIAGVMLRLSPRMGAIIRGNKKGSNGVTEKQSNIRICIDIKVRLKINLNKSRVRS